MKRLVMTGMTAGVLLVFAACGDAQIGDRISADDPATASAFALTEHSETSTRGRVATADGELVFAATVEGVDRSVFNIGMNGKTFEATLRGDATVLEGHGLVLSQADRNLLDVMVRELETRFATEEPFAHDASLHGFAAYLSLAPEGFVHDAVMAFTGESDIASSQQALASGGDEGIKCIKKNTSVQAVYAGANGDLIQESIVVGSNRPNNYGCMGRCGSGCSGFGGGYTKDCLDHDACSDHFKAHGGSRDTNCGDEYKAASDDFLHASACKG